MKIPIMSRYLGYYLISNKINGVKECNTSNAKFGQNKIKLYWYTRKQLKKRIDHGYVEV